MASSHRKEKVTQCPNQRGAGNGAITLLFHTRCPRRAVPEHYLQSFISIHNHCFPPFAFKDSAYLLYDAFSLGFAYLK